MLITPEQKADQGSTNLCNNKNVQESLETSTEQMVCENQQHLDNINLNKGNANECQCASGVNADTPISPCMACLNPSLSSVQSSPSVLYNDFKNSNVDKSIPLRSLQKLKGKFPPQIILPGPKKINTAPVPHRALFLSDDVINDFTQPLSPMSPMSESPTRSPPTTLGGDNDKHELFSGRLHLVRHTGKGSPSQSPSSPSRNSMKGFPFHTPTLASSPSNTSPLLPSSPTLNSKRKMPVYMRVYKCNLDHFALVSRHSSYTPKQIYLNLRHCRIFPGNCLGRFVIAGHCDSGSLMEFETSDLSSLGKWLDALQSSTPPSSPIRGSSSKSGGSGYSAPGSMPSPPIPKSPAMPTLTESIEED